MKFSWGTGVFIFLILFLSAAGVFIVFAMRQDVSLVHEDYYEKGADHGQQMLVEKRSEMYRDSIRTSQEEDYFKVWFSPAMVSAIDSGSLVFFRPSNSSLDLRLVFQQPGSPLSILNEELAPGRYILKFKWYTGELEYGFDRSLYIE